MFLDGFSRKVWAMHRSKVANEIPYLVRILSTMNEKPNDNNENEGARNTTDALVDPYIIICLYQNCSFKVQCVSLDGVVLCEVLQSSNSESLAVTI